MYGPERIGPNSQIDWTWIIILIPILLDILACILHPEYFRPLGPKGVRPVVELFFLVVGILVGYGITFLDWFKLLLSVGSPMRGLQSDETQAGCAVLMIRMGCLVFLYAVAALALSGGLSR